MLIDYNYIYINLCINQDKTNFIKIDVLYSQIYVKLIIDISYYKKIKNQQKLK